jgi:hypothetical protein
MFSLYQVLSTRAHMCMSLSTVRVTMKGGILIYTMTYSHFIRLASANSILGINLDSLT